MYKRRLKSTSSESKIVKKSKPRAPSSTEDELEIGNLPNQKSTTKRSSLKSSRVQTNKKTDSTKKPSSRSNSILCYLKSCPSATSKSNSTLGDREKMADQKDTKDFDRTEERSSFCPKCQMPVKSLDCRQFEEHVWLCIERTFEFEGNLR